MPLALRWAFYMTIERAQLQTWSDKLGVLAEHRWQPVAHANSDFVFLWRPRDAAALPVVTIETSDVGWFAENPCRSFCPASGSYRRRVSLPAWRGSADGVALKMTGTAVFVIPGERQPTTRMQLSWRRRSEDLEGYWRHRKAWRFCCAAEMVRQRVADVPRSGMT